MSETCTDTKLAMAGATGKKLLNSVDRCVDDNLEGYVALNPGVRLLKGRRVVVRADFEELQKTNKVAVVCGGGSGHEPAFSGYVGRGMLAAAAMGAVFASPPPSVMLAAIRAVAKHNPAGCLLLIPNYTGDRLNFGPAAELAQGEGMRVATVIVGEDCALTTHDKSAGRRGLTGIPISIKITGALAEEGRCLEEMVETVSRAISNMATIGVALTSCFVPGSGATFTLPDDEMELGLGAHGEAGVRRLKLDPLHAASTTFTDSLATMTARDAFAAAVKAAETAADSTTKMKAQAGRASYVSADLLTQPDPGAVAVATWMKAVLEKLH